MDNRTKNIIYSLLLLSAVFIVYKCRTREIPIQEPVRIEGRTMGTSYHITYFDQENRNFKASVDSLLAVVNKSINNYDSSSEVSQFNTSPTGVAVRLPYLVPPLRVAVKIHSYSAGAFDPTVMPLVNIWGFGPGEKMNADSAIVDSLRTLVGFDKVIVRDDSVLKTDPRTQLDFGGIGQGYGADVITDFLRGKGITDLLVELGGEGMAVGKNRRTGKNWEIGILDPNSTHENQFFKAYVSLSDRSFTTSGNYFNFHEENGVKYSHTIDPSTGYPARRALLSASVFAEDCTTADAWGTALMVMGHEEGIKLLDKHPEVDALLLYSDENGNIKHFATPGIRAMITFEEER